MRSLLFSLVVAAPSMGFAQTPADVAHLLWPLAAPAMSAAHAPQGGTGAGSFGAADLARQVWPHGVPPAMREASRPVSAHAGSFTPTDLARLRDEPASPAESLPYRLALSGRPK